MLKRTPFRLRDFSAYRLAALALALAFSGCSERDPGMLETDLKAYQRGQRLLTEGRPQEALPAFLAVVRERPANAPQSHLEIGRLYLREFGDPVAAVYHFRRSLEHFEGTERAPLIEGLIQTAHREFARSLPGGPLQSEVARLDLLEILDQTRDQNQDLKQQLAAAQSRIEQLQQVVSRLEEREAVAVTGTTEQAPSNANRPGPPVAAAPEPDEAVGPTEYTVEPGDTLNSIARKMYGTTTRWMDIYQANRDQLPNEHSLRVGQTLRIPR